MNAVEGRSSPRLQRWFSFAVLAVLTVVTIAAAVTARRVVDDQEERLLGQRVDAVSALLSNSFDTVGSSLRVLGAVGASSDQSSSQVFADSATTLLQRNTVSVGVAAEGDGGFSVLKAVGKGPAAGEPLTAERADAVSRALGSGQMASALVHDQSGSRLVIAVPVPASRVVAFQESVVDPSKPAPSNPKSPFREVRASLYASPTADPATLVVKTEPDAHLTGNVRAVPFKVGMDEWLLEIGPRDPLVGDFARTVPWLLLAGGLLTALLASAIVEVMVRRRTYAEKLVTQRTAELEEAFREIRSAQAFLDRLLSALPILVMRVSVTDNQLTYVSPNIERLFGVSQETALAPGFLADRIHPGDLRNVEAALQRVVSEGTEEPLEYRFRNGDGTYRWLVTIGVPELDAAGNTTAILGYGLDVDDRHRAEQAQREAATAAEAANRSKSEFLSRMSHELRTPLNAVLGFGQLLELDDLTEEQRDSVQQILKGGRHLLDLINEVLDISRIEAGHLALSPEPVPAKEIIDEAVDLIRPLADERGVQLVVDRTAPRELFVFADRQRAKQILLNLLSNAVKYNRLRGTVAISCQASSDTAAHITVADTGKGIASERLGLLFTPFERLGAEETDIEGTGIGLALSQRLAQAMKGGLTATSMLGQGSTFVLELPQAEGPVERYERLNGRREPVVHVPAPVQRRVLQIEDNLANVKLVERVLAQRPDVDVIAAMHGSLGLQLAHEHRPVLILLDLHLPDIGGEQVLRRLRDDPITASTPVVIVSADATAGQAQRLLAAGATGYLTKPIDVRQLLDVLDGALNRAVMIEQIEAEQAKEEALAARAPVMLAATDEGSSN